MGSSESKPPSNPVLARIEQEAVRAAVPRGLKDERSRQLEYDLNWCYARNNWYFTAGEARACMRLVGTGGGVGTTMDRSGRWVQWGRRWGWV